jgi:hypothetical protein
MTNKQFSVGILASTLCNDLGKFRANYSNSDFRLRIKQRLSWIVLVSYLLPVSLVVILFLDNLLLLDLLLTRFTFWLLLACRFVLPEACVVKV